MNNINIEKKINNGYVAVLLLSTSEVNAKRTFSFVNVEYFR